jgi:cytoskeletal protein CcmA (bactofilin family)
VEIAPGGELRGEVMTPSLIIDEGAIFEGQSRMVEREGPSLVKGSATESLVGRHEAQRVSG